MLEGEVYEKGGKASTRQVAAPHSTKKPILTCSFLTLFEKQMFFLSYSSDDLGFQVSIYW